MYIIYIARGVAICIGDRTIQAPSVLMYHVKSITICDISLLKSIRSSSIYDY